MRRNGEAAYRYYRYELFISLLHDSKSCSYKMKHALYIWSHKREREQKTMHIHLFWHYERKKIRREGNTIFEYEKDVHYWHSNTNNSSWTWRIQKLFYQQFWFSRTDQDVLKTYHDFLACTFFFKGSGKILASSYKVVSYDLLFRRWLPSKRTCHDLDRVVS